MTIAGEGATMHLTDLENRILRACNGEIVSLPYNREQSAATLRLESLGLLARCIEEDQPTAFITDVGRVVLASLQSKDTDNV